MRNLSGLIREIQIAMYLIVNKNGGEYHGDIDAIVDALVCEIGGPCSAETINEFKQRLIELSLEFLTVGIKVAYFRSMNGEIHLVHRNAIER